MPVRQRARDPYLRTGAAGGGHLRIAIDIDIDPRVIGRAGQTHGSAGECDDG